MKTTLELDREPAPRHVRERDENIAERKAFGRVSLDSPFRLGKRGSPVGQRPGSADDVVRVRDDSGGLWELYSLTEPWQIAHA